MRINKVYQPAFYDTNRYLLLYGGSGSGKSVFAAQKQLLRVLNEPGHKILVIRKVAATLRNSVYSLIKQMIADEGITKFFTFTTNPMEIINRANGSMFVFAGLDDPEKLKSIAGITSVWFEEATEGTKQDFMQLDLRLRGQTASYKQIVLSFNPIAATHWLNRDFCQQERANATILRTTYRDNNFIDDDYKRVLAELAGQDENYFKIYSEGEWGVLKDIVYKPFFLIDKWPAGIGERWYGLDFGFNAPSALIEIGHRDDAHYLREKIYKRGLTNQDLIGEMENVGIDREDPIYCDPSEPDRIKELRRAGFNARKADKKSVKNIHDFCKRQRIYSLKSNDNTNRENLAYKYKEDKDGNVLDEPVKFNDHAMDAMGYGIYTHHKKAAGISAELI